MWKPRDTERRTHRRSPHRVDTAEATFSRHECPPRASCTVSASPTSSYDRSSSRLQRVTIPIKGSNRNRGCATRRNNALKLFRTGEPWIRSKPEDATGERIARIGVDVSVRWFTLRPAYTFLNRTNKFKRPRLWPSDSSLGLASERLALTSGARARTNVGWMRECPSPRLRLCYDIPRVRVPSVKRSCRGRKHPDRRNTHCRRMLWTPRCSLILVLITLASCTDATTDPTEDEKAIDGTTTGVPTLTLVPDDAEPAPVNNSSNVVKSPAEENVKDSSHAPLPSSSPSPDTVWECPNITKAGVECSCDFPHTLRCTGDRTTLQTISKHLRSSRPGTISLLDVTVSGISLLPARFLEGVALHGLVVSTGELRRVHDNAFTALTRPLQALGLPNNLLDSVPTVALSHLVGLERLDLSQNKLKTLEADSFKGMSNLTYLDLCDNLLSQLSPQAFVALPSLRSLKMRGNRLSVSALSAFRGLKNLEELDLSNNLLLGPMGPNLLPKMPRLRTLTVSENELINITQGALIGLRNLTYLSLSHNQIDVLEDDSFKYLSTLTRLDLANNRIVAVSSASLAHLEKLTTLDLTHNFLRSLTADLVVPLKSLQDLRLDDNDITMVASDVPTSKLRLKKLSLADNPLNCDCTLLEFANWLSNSSLNEEDKSSAVCATPPALENGVLTQVSPGSLLCGEPTPPITNREPPTGTQLTLKEFHYDKSTGVNLLWHVEICAEHYTCDTLMVYETIGDSEVQTVSSSLHCDSRMMRDPCSLPVAIPASLNLQPGHNYRYCVVILVPGSYDEVSLGLGCSDVLTLRETKRELQKDEETPVTESTDTRITGVHVNVSDQGFLHVDVSLSTPKKFNLPECKLSIVVFDAESAVRKQKLNCSLTFVTLEVLLPGRYKVCASLDEVNEEDVIRNFMNRDRLHCVEVQGFKQNTEIIVLVIIGAGCALLVALVLLARSVVKRVRHPRIQTQCFLPAQEFEITHKAHYIKLLATTKV